MGEATEEHVTSTARRATWRDWLPEGAAMPDLITRAELLAQLAADGVPVTERTLRYWERPDGPLPRPVRQFHGDAVHAVYPAWYPQVVAQAARLHELDTPLGVMRPHLRGLLAVATAPRADRHDRDRAPLALPDSVQRELTAFMREHDIVHTRVLAQMRDGRGWVTVLTLDDQ